MIRSQFIRDIISLLLDGDDEYILIRKQADWITEENFKYTGHGVFVHFKLEEQALKYRLDMKDFWLNGVLIKSDEIDIAAEAIIDVSKGLINYLEIWSYGEMYPRKDPDHYVLEQQWKKGENNIVIKR
jgi:hypothetical protein